MTRALVVGRFQPFHRGHLAVFKEAASLADELIVCIAAAADSSTADNPFTAAERGEMIRLALDAEGVGPYRVVDVPDIHNYPVWARYVIDLCPEFDLVVAHNPTTLDLFRKEGVEVREATPFDMDTHSGTRIRKLMAEGGEWEDLVPPVVARFLRDIDAPSRLIRT